MQQTIQTLERYNQTMRNQLDGMLRGPGTTPAAGATDSSIAGKGNASSSNRGKSKGPTAAELAKSYLDDFSSSDAHKKIMQAAFASNSGPMSGLNIMGLVAGSLSNAANGVKGTSWNSSP
jgi:hypothetical protein